MISFLQTPWIDVAIWLVPLTAIVAGIASYIFAYDRGFRHGVQAASKGATP